MCVPLLLTFMSTPIKKSDLLLRLCACVNRFSSWMYYARQLDLLEISPDNALDLNYYDENCSYQIQSSQNQKYLHLYDCCPEPFVEITITLHLVPKE